MAARRAALGLAEQLALRGLSGEVHEGFGVAVVWVGARADVVVWTNGTLFRWWTGRVSESGRRIYTYGVADSPATAARRVDQRYRQVTGGSGLGGEAGMREPGWPLDERSLEAIRHVTMTETIAKARALLQRMTARARAERELRERACNRRLEQPEA
ncbi:hypothetical protein D5H75_21635 [Bailinhaonella thermotolerans]|uniref:Uncharacterized protein n=2 Tax=Bailinhaonella thermotolerans TaxID=1070861 RepID=A0A3A4B0B9_9ACTN|nr:hypothetical protein D5H75_21635 [Bailinhaonella thermotolerans]